MIREGDSPYVDSTASRLNLAAEVVTGDIDGFGWYDAEVEGSIIERLEALEAENEELKDELFQLRRIVSPDPDHVDYERLSRPEKVRRVRETLLCEAMRSNGHAKMNYREVKMLFNGRPADSHAYDLMELAAEEDGFEYQDKPQKRIVVNSGRVTDEGLILDARKAIEGEAA